MSSPITHTPTTGRNRGNVFTGAPDVRYSGGFWIGPPAYDSSLFPQDPFEDSHEIATRLGMDSAGFITSDGVSKNADRSTEKLLDWNLDLIDVITTDFGVQLTVTFAEAANGAVLRAIYGDDNVEIVAPDDTAGTPGYVHIKEKSDDLPRKSIMFDLKGKGDAKGRGFAAETQVSAVGEIAFNKQSLIQYAATIDVFSDVDATYVHTWLSQGGTVVAGTVDPDPESP